MSLLKGVKILDTLREDEINNLSCFCQEKILSPWEVLFREWEEANSLYILKTGKISISRKVNGVDIALWYVKAEDMLWEMALFSDSMKRMGTATVVEDSRLIVLLSFSIHELTDKHPDLLHKIQSIIKKRLVDNKISLSGL